MFESVLVANRGEIACRIISTCARMGIRTVAVYSDADAGARHVEMADEALPVGRPPPVQSYLNVDAILAAAGAAGASAIHPGYGFLAENATFARRVANAGLAFVGPPPDAIAAMGDKVVARRTAVEAGVPVTPGTDALPTEEAAVAAADSLGYPVLVKAAGGGGGIGMTVAKDPEELRKALATAGTRGERFFGNPDVYLERYLERPRHVEVQVFADTYGTGVHLYERECSVQRRHQKVIEESPSCAVTPSLLERMCEAALALVKKVGYVNAGTVECLVSGDEFFFLEMNTRLQVEHPVTEATTGIDLVEWQLRVAAGEAVPICQSDIGRTGHAIEMRVYAEDPVRFLPSPGTVTRFEPPSGEGIRVDSGIRSGDEVTQFYDPLLAKLVCAAPTRAEALDRALGAVRAFTIEGIKHNLPFHERVLESEAFRSGHYDTQLLERLRVAVAPAAGARTVDAAPPARHTH